MLSRLIPLFTFLSCNNSKRNNDCYCFFFFSLDMFNLSNWFSRVLSCLLSQAGITLLFTVLSSVQQFVFFMEDGQNIMIKQDIDTDDIFCNVPFSFTG